jgi:hypothetical protein
VTASFCCALSEARTCAGQCYGLHQWQQYLLHHSYTARNVQELHASLAMLHSSQPSSGMQCYNTQSWHACTNLLSRFTLQDQSSCPPLDKSQILAYPRDPTVPGSNVITFPGSMLWGGVPYNYSIRYHDFSTHMSIGENAADRGYVVHKRDSWKVRCCFFGIIISITVYVLALVIISVLAHLLGFACCLYACSLHV